MNANYFFKISLHKFVLLISLFSNITFWGCSTAAHLPHYTYFVAGDSTIDSLIIPGVYSDYTLLPNGWKLTPVGEHMNIGELPLNMIITKDEMYAIVSNSGTGEHSLSVVDIKNKKEVQRIVLDKTWRGLTFNLEENLLFASGSYDDLIYIFDFHSGKLSLRDTLILNKESANEKISVTGLCFFPNRNFLLVVSKGSNSFYVCDLSTKSVIKKINLNSECYDVIINHSQTRAFVSLWGDGAIAEIDLSNFELMRKIKVGDHPCELLLSKDDSRLFVTNANNNSTSVVDLSTHKESEKIISSLKADVPYGSTPNSLTFNSGESILIIANADNNHLALFDISEKNKTKSLGFIPTGWYPTSVKFLAKSNQIIVANGKGLASQANPEGPKPTEKDKYITDQFIGTLFKGVISIIDFPRKAQLSRLSEQVYSNTPYTNKNFNREIKQSVVPIEHDGTKSEKLKYVFYIIKENRTYDQVFGDITFGNGDSSLCLFPREVTPNQHRLAEEFVLFDNFYVDAEVSADGHNWSTAAYATDYVEKNWPTLYGKHAGSYDFEGGVPIASPSSGYIWDNVINNNLRFRNYGEFVERSKVNPNYYQARDEYLNDYTCSDFPGYDLSISDIVRFEKWSEDFDKLAEKDSLPHVSLLRLPNDHTAGTRAGSLTPKAYVAQNDYSLGLIIDKISKSKYWKETAIFVLEDDAQNGSDHVDAHRSILLVISPYVKRNFVDHTMYSTSSVLKTMELILGLPPMTQYDLSATPILDAFTDNPNFTSYSVIEPLINIEEKNSADAYGSARSEELNLSKEDAIPDIEFNEIIWKSIKGVDSEMPAPVRSAFVKIISNNKDDD